MDKIRNKATLLAIITVLLLIGYFVFNTLENKRRIIDKETNTHHELLHHSYKLAVLDTEKGLNHLAFEMLTDRRLVDAFEAHERDTLYEVAMPYLNEALSRGEADLVGFIGADGAHFLRLLDPKKFGDNITKERPMIAKALQMRQPIISLDVTRYNISLVNIVPVFKNKNFLGLLQVSAKIDRIQERLNAYAGIKSALAFDTDALRKLLPDTHFKEYGEYSLISFNDPLFLELPQKFALEEPLRYSNKDLTHIVAAQQLSTYDNSSLVRIISAIDISKDEIAHKRDIRKLLLVSLIVLILLSVVLYVGFKALIDRIRSLSAIHVEELEHQLYSDPLTGLPNRKALLEDLPQKEYVAILLLNIDNFKEMNDLYGHEIGDKILLSVANAIKEVTAAYPLTLYRMHSDEYALGLSEAVPSDVFDEMGKGILLALHQRRYSIEGITVFVSLSMGVDICSEDKCDLIGRADMALKTAKKRGLSFVKFENALHVREDYLNNISWTKKIKDAIDEQRFTLHYQGIHETSSQKIFEYEALVRMIDNDGSLIPPLMFLDIAKKSRLYPHITNFVIQEIFRQLKKTPHRYSINLSIDDIMDQETQEMIYGLLRDSNVGDRLIFEILESEGIENYEEVSAFIAAVKEYGCRIAIDDFGIGYSNFAHIMRLNVDFIKIDASLIKNIDTDPGAQNIVRTIVDFSHRLNLQTVAEFVSSEEIYNECKRVGVDYIQGYYLSRPEPVV
ncbi:MAG: EAL domain-containing protein [Campylobacterales bacterium]|nr:EAL domain-containing protein [Campylobacterales bacterium]